MSGTNLCKIKLLCYCIVDQFDSKMSPCQLCFNLFIVSQGINSTTCKSVVNISEISINYLYTTLYIPKAFGKKFELEMHVSQKDIV